MYIRESISQGAIVFLGTRDIVERGSLGSTITRSATQRQSLLVITQRPLLVSQRIVDAPNVGQRSDLTATISQAPIEPQDLVQLAQCLVLVPFRAAQGADGRKSISGNPLLSGLAALEPALFVEFKRALLGSQ